MTKDEALKLAQRALSNKRSSDETVYKALHAIHKALAQPSGSVEQELTKKHRDEWDIAAFVNNHFKEEKIEPVFGYCPECGSKGVVRERRPFGRDKCFNGHVYPSTQAVVQPQRTWEKPWVSLTDEERQAIADEYQSSVAAALMTEAKLKEKNT